MAYFQMVFNALWQIANFNLNFGTFTIKIWYPLAFGIIFGLLLKLLFGGDNNGSK